MIRFACLLTILILSAVVSVGLLVGTQADISVVMATAGQRELSGRINFQALFGSIKTGELATIHAKVTEAPSRLAGTSSEREVSKFVENEFHRLGLETVIQSYPVTIPVTRWCRITDVHNQQLPGISITPFWPNFVRTCTTPAEGIIGQVVDVGGGSLAELDGKQIEGNIALVTMGQGVGWLDAAKLGATAILFAESDDPVVYNDKHLKFPANLPRFLLTGPPDQVVGKRVRLTARVDWQIREARNVFGVLHPSDQSEEALIILSHTDSWSTVPARAPGFQDACTVTSMLGIARALQTQQDGLSRTVIFGAISGRYSGSEGIRRMLDAVGSRTQNEPNLVRAHRRLAGSAGLELRRSERRASRDRTGRVCPDSRRPQDFLTAPVPATRRRVAGLCAPAMLRQMVDEEFHLVGEDVAVRQDQMLDPTRPIRHGEQRHAGLLRRMAALADIAGEAGADHVLPRVAAALGQRNHVVASQLTAREVFAAIQAEHAVACEQRGIGQRGCGIDRVQACMAAARGMWLRIGHMRSRMRPLESSESTRVAWMSLTLRGSNSTMRSSSRFVDFGATT